MTITTPAALVAPAPAERLGIVRILVTSFTLVYLLVRLPHLLDVAHLAETVPERFTPVGPLVVLDAPIAPAPAVAVLVATLLVGLGAVAGWRWRLTGPAFAAGVLVVLSYRNSWGQIFHTENLVVLHLAVLALVPAADAWSLDERRRLAAGEHRPRRDAGLAYGWPLQLMAVIVAVAYLLAGWAKIRASGWGWVSGDALRNLVAHDALRKRMVGSHASPIGVWALRHDWLFTPMAALSLVVELAAPVLLLGGRWRAAWVVAAWVFHLGVLAIMGILFPYQTLGVAFACCFAVETLPRRVTRRRAILAP